MVQALFNVFSVILVEFMSNLLYLLECSWPNILRVFISNTRPYRHPYLSFLKLKRFWEKDFLKDEPIEYKNWVILIKLFSLSFADKSKLNSKLICSFSLLSDTSFKSIHQTIKKGMENKFKTGWQTMIKTTVPFGFIGGGGFIGKKLITGKEAAWKTLQYNYC